MNMCGDSDLTPRSISEGFALQLINRRMPSQNMAAPRNRTPTDAEEEGMAGRPRKHSARRRVNLDEYPIEVLEAVLGVLQAQEQQASGM
jgi:hypothetical protein